LPPFEPRISWPRITLDEPRIYADHKPRIYADHKPRIYADHEPRISADNSLRRKGGAAGVKRRASVLVVMVAGVCASGWGLASGVRGAANDVPLFADDFSRFKPGVLSAPLGLLNGAIQEYHYIEHRGVPTHPWRNPIVHLDSWAAGDEDSTPYLEQHLTNDDLRFSPLFVTGDPEWRDYRVEVSVKPLSLEKDAGLVFRYRTSRHHYRLALEGGTRLRLVARLPFDREFRVAAWREIAAAPFTYDPRTWYRLEAIAEGNRLRASVDGKQLIDVTDGELGAGIAGLTANMPARFRAFRVTAGGASAAALRERIGRRDAALETLRAGNPRPVLWKKFEMRDYGAGRNVRFGDLDGDGRLDMLFAQNVPKVRGDAFDHISCLTAVTLDGRILWQQGRPNPQNGLLTNDNPFQIHDLDGDGRTEIVVARDSQLQILEGSTGKLLRKTWLPRIAPEVKDRPYELNIGDSLLFVDLSGTGRPREILLKDRYRGFWIFDQDLTLRWEGLGQTGHYPYPVDVDGDGKQEFLIGYSLWGADGKPRWSHDAKYRDHADALSVGNFSGRPSARMRAYIDGSDEGFLVFEADGTLVKHHRLGHAQTQSIAKYRTDLPGLQILIANFWRNPGIVTMLDADGEILAQEEMIPGSSHLEPVNWRGDGQEFALLSGNVREGGMIDGQLRRVVMFPEDGHPDLASAVRDLTGDRRDEVMLWDQTRVWIYTQDRPFTGAKLYAPRRNPHYNDSNYRATVSQP
jgi:rhamnogalacturonan endolyase